MTKPSNTYFADSTLSLTGKTGEAVRWEQDQKQGQFPSHRNTGMSVVTRKILLYLQQLSKIRALCHPRFLVICTRVQTFFLSSVSPATHMDLQWRPKKLHALSSPPVHLATQTGLPSRPFWSLKNTSGSEAPRGHASVCGPAQGHPGILPLPAAIHLCVNCTSSHVA